MNNCLLVPTFLIPESLNNHDASADIFVGLLQSKANTSIWSYMSALFNRPP